MCCKFMIVAGEATLEMVVAIGLDFVVVVHHYFNEFYIILNELLKI